MLISNQNNVQTVGLSWPMRHKIWLRW